MLIMRHHVGGDEFDLLKRVRIGGAQVLPWCGGHGIATDPLCVGDACGLLLQPMVTAAREWGQRAQRSARSSSGGAQCAQTKLGCRGGLSLAALASGTRGSSTHPTATPATDAPSPCWIGSRR
jgi:hypothetical protein